MENERLCSTYLIFSVSFLDNVAGTLWIFFFLLSSSSSLFLFYFSCNFSFDESLSIVHVIARIVKQKKHVCLMNWKIEKSFFPFLLNFLFLLYKKIVERKWDPIPKTPSCAWKLINYFSIKFYHQNNPKKKKNDWNSDKNVIKFFNHNIYHVIYLFQMSRWIYGAAVRIQEFGWFLYE